MFTNHHLHRVRMLATLIGVVLLSAPASSGDGASSFAVAETPKLVAAKAHPAAGSREIVTQISCRDRGEGEGGWSCPGIAQPGTFALLSYSVSTLPK